MIRSLSSANPPSKTIVHDQTKSHKTLVNAIDETPWESLGRRYGFDYREKGKKKMNRLPVTPRV